MTIVNNTIIWGGDSPHNNPLKVDLINGENDALVETVEFMNEDIPPLGGSNFRTFDLAGKTMPNFFKLKMYGGSRGTDGQPATIDTDATFDILVELENVSASHVSGAKIPSQSIDDISGTLNMSVPYPIIVGDFDLVGESEIKIDYTSPIPAEMILHFTSVSDTEQVELQHITNDTIRVNIGAGTTSVLLSANEYNINNFLEILPDYINYTFEASIGDTSQVYELDMQDEITMEISINGDLQIQTQAEGIWAMPAENDLPMITTEDTKDFDHKIYDSFRRGALIFEYTNTTGYELAADILVADDSIKIAEEMYNFTTTDTSKVQLFQIPKLEITASDPQEFEFSIEQNDLDFFLADSVYVGTRVFIYSTGIESFSGEVSMIGKVKLKILIDENLVKE